MEFTGIVKVLLPIRSGVSQSGNAWRVLEAVIEEEGRQYPNSIVVSQSGDNIEQQRLIVGRKVKVHLNAVAREYNSKYYQSLSVWKVEQLDQAEQQSVPQQAPPQPQWAPPTPEQKDDLPF